MIELDGSHGEGGGAILRTALALSTITGKPFHITKIRANRPQTGIKAQHLETIRAFLAISDANTEGLTLGSETLEFHPGRVKAGTYDIRIGTAGSITLVLQALLPAILHSKQRVTLKLRGGTDVKWSPSWDYFANVLLPHLAAIGTFETQLNRRGYYPQGDGLITITIQTVDEPKPLDLRTRGALIDIHAISHASAALRVRSVPERINAAFEERHTDAIVKSTYAVTASLGAGITAWAQFTNTTLGVDTLGDIRLHSEEVGERAARDLHAELIHGAPIDTHLTDMLPIYLALYGGTITIPKRTDHLESNLHVIEQFMPGRLSREELTISAREKT